MNPLMLMAMFGRAAVLQTVTFSSNTTWVAPAGVSMLSTVIGHGGVGTAGSPEEPGVEYYDVTTTVEDTYDAPQYGTYSFTSDTNRVFTTDSNVPDHCESSYSSSLHRTREICFETMYGDTGTTPAVPPTSGPSATGFGKTFPGGVGAVAGSTITYSNVAITPGSSNNIVVPAGAAVQITYYL
jgi:hypothetical protein